MLTQRLFAWGLSLLTTVAIAAPTSRIALSLDKGEPYALNLFHAGFYFTGHSRQTDTEQHRIEVYSSDLSTKVKEIAVPHTVESIAPLSANEVLVVGKHYSTEWFGYYTVVTVKNGTFSPKTTKFSTDFMPEFFAGKAGQLYFNEAGNAGVFRWNGSSGQMLPVKLSGPGRMAYTGTDLFVIERRNLLLFGDEQLTRVNLASQKATSVFPTIRNGLAQVQYLPNSGLVAVSETLADQVHLVDPSTNQVVESVTTATPEGLVAMGNCLAVSSREEKRATLFLVAKGQPTKTVDTWDLTALGGNLHNTRHITADGVGKRLYVRSQDMCPSCVSSRNVVAVIENLGEDFKACGL